jgi:hypothetical protein
MDPRIRIHPKLSWIRNTGFFAQGCPRPNIRVPPDFYLYVILVDRPCYLKSRLCKPPKAQPTKIPLVCEESYGQCPDPASSKNGPDQTSAEAKNFVFAFSRTSRKQNNKHFSHFRAFAQNGKSYDFRLKIKTWQKTPIVVTNVKEKLVKERRKVLKVNCPACFGEKVRRIGKVACANWILQYVVICFI